MTVPPEARLATRLVHAGLEPDPSFGSIVPPIHQVSTYVQSAPGEFVGEFDYARSANPTRAALERALGELEGGHASAFASGMAATHALITAVAGAGSHVVLPDDLYGGTFRLVDKVLSRWGLEHTLVDQRDLDAVEAAVRDDTALIWVETPTNPALNVIDIGGVVARARGALVAVDNTFATPVIQRPIELGADAVVHSTTKYLGGHSDTVGGAVVVSDPGAARARPLRAERGGSRARPARLLPRAPRDPDARHSRARTHRQRARAERVPGRGARGVRRALARVRRHGVVQASGRAPDRRVD